MQPKPFHLLSNLSTHNLHRRDYALDYHARNRAPKSYVLGYRPRSTLSRHYASSDCARANRSGSSSPHQSSEGAQSESESEDAEGSIHE